MTMPRLIEAARARRLPRSDEDVESIDRGRQEAGQHLDGHGKIRIAQKAKLSPRFDHAPLHGVALAHVSQGKQPNV